MGGYEALDPRKALFMSEIIMYGAEWCGDCRRSKAFLNDHEVAFTYVDLERQPEAISIVLERNDGRRVIPTIVFPDGTHLTEPSDQQLMAKLGL